jgi:SPRY domain
LFFFVLEIGTDSASFVETHLFFNQVQRRKQQRDDSSKQVDGVSNPTMSSDPSGASAVGGSNSRFAAASSNPASQLGHDNNNSRGESSTTAASAAAYCHPLVPPSSIISAAAGASSTSTTTTTTTTGTAGGGGFGFGGRKRSRESSPVPPDSQLQSAIAAAAQALSNLGYFGLAGLLQQASASPSACTSDNLLNSILSVHQVRLAATKACTEQPPWIHWNRSDMASTTLRVTGQHRLGLAQHASALRGYRMARASVGCSQGCYYYECWILPGPSTQEILANFPSNARLGPGLQKRLQASLEYEQQQQERERKMNSTASQQALLEERSSAAPMPPPLPPLKPPPPAVGGHVRVGWSMRTGDLQAPVGYDKWSYGIRDTGGSIIHQSQRQDHWGGQRFGPGDIVGCAVILDPIVDPVANNHVRFFKNGECMGDFVIIKGNRRALYRVAVHSQRKRIHHLLAKHVSSQLLLLLLARSLSFLFF